MNEHENQPQQPEATHLRELCVDHHRTNWPRPHLLGCADTGDRIGETNEHNRATFERILASYNATAGIPTEDLRTDCIAKLVDAARKALDVLRGERFTENVEAQLVEALRRVHP